VPALQGPGLILRNLPDHRTVNPEVPVDGQVTERTNLPPGCFWVPVAHVVWERAGNFAEQGHPVQHGVTKHPVAIPALTAHAVQVLADERWVSRLTAAVWED
jgi:hypothetical protein